MPLNTKRIRELREELGLTLEQAAHRAGMKTRQQWANIERGERTNISPDRLYTVAKALEVTMEELMIPPRVRSSQ